MDLSSKAQNMYSSGNTLIFNQVAKLKSSGEKIINLNLGEINIRTHSAILDATINALRDGKTRYSSTIGEVLLREEICNYISYKYDLKIKNENVFVGNGSKQILYITFQLILNKDDEVIVPVPYWPTIPEIVKLTGGVNVFVETKKDFHLDLEKIKKSISKKTKAIYINTPNNPTGVLYSKEELKELIDIAQQNNLYIISDESYEALLYDKEFIPIRSLCSKVQDQIISIQSFSKSFCMTGFRIGYMIANKAIISKAVQLQGHLAGNVPLFTQYGAFQALKNHLQIIPALKKEIKRRRDLSYKLFSKIFPTQLPDGALYLFLDISQYIKKGLVQDSLEMAEFILKHTKTALVPGRTFGSESYIRLAFTASQEDLIESAARISKILIK